MPSLIELLYRLSKNKPNDIAVLDKNDSLTFLELERITNQCANWLKSHNVLSGDIVPIISDKNITLIVLLISIWKLNAGFFIVNPSIPIDRIKFSIEKIKPKILLKFNNEKIETSWFKNCIDVNAFNKKYFSDQKLTTSFNPLNIAYLIFTSGTTGQPKGVKVSFENLSNYLSPNKTNLLSWKVNTCKNASAISLANVSFDLFILEFTMLFLGAKIYIATVEESMDIFSLTKTIIDKNINILTITPTKFAVYSSNETFEKILSNLKILMFGAESLHPHVIEKIDTDKTYVINAYGPSECTIACMYSEIKKNKEISIGKPAFNTNILLIDNKGKVITKKNEIGEIYVQGKQVTSGYIEDIEKTNLSYINFNNEWTYKTGDFGKLNAKNEVIYMGRKDDQLKINGQRIELLEIENVANSYPKIKTAVVVTKKNFSALMLCLYFIADSKISIKDYLVFLKSKLPSYVVPTYIKQLKKFVTNQSGKVDRNYLINLSLDEYRYEKPSNLIENDLLNIYKSFNTNANVGVLHEFKSIGLDSLNIMQFVFKANDIGYKIQPSDMYKYTNFRKLGNFINHQKQKIKTSLSKIENKAKQTNVIIKNKYNKTSIIQSNKPKNILITGITGFLGANLLKELINSDCSIHCFVRSQTYQDALYRVAKTLKYYFGEEYKIIFQYVSIKIFIHNINDLHDGFFGMSKEKYMWLSRIIDVIYNTTANVKYFGDARTFYNDNVNSVKKLLNFAKVNNAKFIHMSTLSVSANDVFDDKKRTLGKKFDENVLFINQSINNIYVQTKLMAEIEIICSKTSLKNILIMRLGNLTNRTDSGIFQENFNNNAFFKQMLSWKTLRIIPDNLKNDVVDISPIDLVAKSIKALSEFDGLHIFHICSPFSYSYNYLIKQMRKNNIDINFISSKKFYKTLNKSENWWCIYNAFFNNLDANKSIILDNGVLIKCLYTQTMLERVGVQWKQLNNDYFKKYFDNLLDK